MAEFAQGGKNAGDDAGPRIDQRAVEVEQQRGRHGMSSFGQRRCSHSHCSGRARTQRSTQAFICAVSAATSPCRSPVRPPGENRLVADDAQPRRAQPLDMHGQHRAIEPQRQRGGGRGGHGGAAEERRGNAVVHLLVHHQAQHAAVAQETERGAGAGGTLGKLWHGPAGGTVAQVDGDAIDQLVARGAVDHSHAHAEGGADGGQDFPVAGMRGDQDHRAGMRRHAARDFFSIDLPPRAAFGGAAQAGGVRQFGDGAAVD